MNITSIPTCILFLPTFSRMLEVNWNWNSKNDLKPTLLPEFLFPVGPNPTYPTDGICGKPLNDCAFLVDIVLEGKVGVGQITNEQACQLFRYLSAMSGTGSRYPRGEEVALG